MNLRKRLLAASVAGLLTVSVAMPGYAVSTSESLFDAFVDRFATVLDSSDDTEKMLGDLFALLPEYKGNTDLKAEIASAIGDLPQSEQDRLKKFGFGDTATEQANTVFAFLNAVLDAGPSGQNDTTNVFIKMLDGGLTKEEYATYRDDLATIGHSVYDELPADFRTEIASWTTEETDQLAIFSTLVKSVIDEKIGTAITYKHRSNSANDYVKIDLALQESVKATLKTKLGTVVNEKVDEPQISEIVDAFYDFTNVMLKAAENIAGYDDENEVAGGTQSEPFEDVLVAASLVTTEVKYFGQAPDDGDDDDDDDVVTPPDTGDDTGDDTPTGDDGDDTVDDDTPDGDDQDDQDDQGDQDTDEDEYTSPGLENAIENIQKISEQSSEQAKATVQDVADKLSAEIETDEVEETAAVTIVKTVKQAVDKLLEKEDVSAEDAQEVVSSVLKKSVKNAVAKDRTGAATDDIEDDALDMVEKVVEKAGRVTVDTPAEETATQKTLKADNTTVAAAVEKAKAAVDEMKLDMQEAGLGRATSKMKPKVVLDLGNEEEEKETLLELDPEVLNTIKGADSNLQVRKGKTKFDLPSELLADLGDETLQVSSAVVPETDVQAISNAGTRKGLQVEPISSVYEFDIRTSTRTLDFGLLQPTLSINIADILAEQQRLLDQHLYAAHVYDEDLGIWDYVPSFLRDDDMRFTPPHFSKYSVMKGTVNFTDIQDHWAKTTIEQMAVNDIVSGKSATAFDPNAQITRAEFATILVNMLDLEGTVPANFKDIPEDAWYYDTVGLAAVNGLVSGVGDGNFAPNAPVTRQDMAVMIGKAYAIKKDRSMKGDAKDFTDMAMVADYAKKYVDAARYQKIVGGYADGTFRPMQTATRAEAAQMVKVLWEK